MGRVDRVRVVIVVVPVDDQRSRLHFEDEAAAEPLPWTGGLLSHPQDGNCGSRVGVEVEPAGGRN